MKSKCYVVIFANKKDFDAGVLRIKQETKMKNWGNGEPLGGYTPLFNDGIFDVCYELGDKGLCISNPISELAKARPDLNIKLVTINKFINEIKKG